MHNMKNPLFSILSAVLTPLAFLTNFKILDADELEQICRREIFTFQNPQKSPENDPYY